MRRCGGGNLKVVLCSLFGGLSEEQFQPAFDEQVWNKPILKPTTWTYGYCGGMYKKM
jgi:hypothetical protein